MHDYTAGHTLAARSGAPACLFEHLTATLYCSLVSKTAKYHKSRDCSLVRTRNTRLGRVTVNAATVTPARECLCLPSWAPETWQPLLDALSPIADLTDAASVVSETSTPRDVALVIDRYEHLSDYGAQILTALREGGAALPALDEARRWLTSLTSTLADAYTRARAVRASDPDREIRDAAVTLAGALTVDGGDYPTITEGWGMRSDIADEALAALAASLRLAPDTTTARAAAVGVIDDLEPESLAQVPPVPVESAANLMVLIVDTWRAAARVELGAVVDAWLARYEAARTRTEPTILVLTGRSDEPAPLARFPHTVRGEHMLYLAPAVLARGYSAISYDVVADDVPVPAIAGLPDLSNLLDARALTAPGALDVLWDSDFVTALLVLLEDLGAEDAVTGALGITHAA